MARPSKYRPEFVKAVRQLTRLGAINSEIAEAFDVEESTIKEWRRKYPEFSAALKEGKEVADAKVQRSLFERATGYSHPDTKFATFNGKITDSQEFTKHYPPDVTAAIFWLKNRQPGKWRDKIDHDVEFSGDVKFTLGSNVED